MAMEQKSTATATLPRERRSGRLGRTLSTSSPHGGVAPRGCGNGHKDDTRQDGGTDGLRPARTMSSAYCQRLERFWPWD
ncbi:hypothetical protein FNF29_07476 [Cafeteria roenbergensis]|uniref:Uncharacterized protein n=1 Tax=Cafeteria roenbergensis TaxID=33653 RepID=A0A5A8C300_CAFRO|nr:hypothetical protein FNF29_07476 [Cafeteria roenbergensis]|eukprot:KAA0147308.1 hypothetical protein FNF29_07476 [Cafeteria roenbergensis]